MLSLSGWLMVGELDYQLHRESGFVIDRRLDPDEFAEEFLWDTFQ